jgi:hypothetical protein
MPTGAPWIRHGEAILTRFSWPPALEARMAETAGVVLSAEGRFEEAVREERRAIAILESHLRPSSYRYRDSPTTPRISSTSRTEREARRSCTGAGIFSELAGEDSGRLAFTLPQRRRDPDCPGTVRRCEGRAREGAAIREVRMGARSDRLPATYRAGSNWRRECPRRSRSPGGVVCSSGHSGSRVTAEAVRARARALAVASRDRKRAGTSSERLQAARRSRPTDAVVCARSPPGSESMLPFASPTGPTRSRSLAARYAACFAFRGRGSAYLGEPADQRTARDPSNSAARV